MSERVTPEACPDCGGANLRHMGAIPPANIFAGRKLVAPFLLSALFRCEDCALMFRYPTMSEAEMWGRYEQGEPENWQAPMGTRMDWRLILARLEQLRPFSRVLDFGCYDGAFLQRIGALYPGVELLGVEANSAAAARARDAGIEMAGDDFATLSALPQKVDVVLALDVIEHAVSPLRALSCMSDMLAPGGYVFVATGTTDAWTWRWCGSRYWYCHLAEHVGFISEQWAQRVAPQLGLEFMGMTRYSHLDGATTLQQKLYETVANLCYRASPGLFSALRRRGLGGIDARAEPDLAAAPPYWLTARDHALFEFRKVAPRLDVAGVED